MICLHLIIFSKLLHFILKYITVIYIYMVNNINRIIDNICKPRLTCKHMHMLLEWLVSDC